MERDGLGSKIEWKGVNTKVFNGQKLDMLHANEQGMWDEAKPKKKKVSCSDCGRPYGKKGWIEAIIPDKIWIKISPTGDIDGILCISCISDRLEALGYKDIPVWLCGTEPITAIEGDPSDKLDILRNFDQDE